VDFTAFGIEILCAVAHLAGLSVLRGEVCGGGILCPPHLAEMSKCFPHSA